MGQGFGGSAEGDARFVPAGSKLVFQMHYTPNGTVQTDRSRVGLVFADPEIDSARAEVGHGLGFQVPNPSRRQ